MTKPFWGLHNTLANIYLDKLQITPLKFESIRILHPKISNFRFYPLKFGVSGSLNLIGHIWSSNIVNTQSAQGKESNLKCRMSSVLNCQTLISLLPIQKKKLLNKYFLVKNLEDNLIQIDRIWFNFLERTN